MHAHPHLWDTRRDDDMFVILSWSSSGASLEPFSQIHTFRPLDVIILLLPRDGFWPADLIQLQIWMTRITHLMMDVSRSFDFPTYRTPGAILGIFSPHYLLAFSFWRSELHLQLGAQNHHLSLVWYSNPPYFLNLGVQSHYILSFGVQSHHFLSLGVQSHHHILILGVQIHHLLSLGIQSYHLFSISAFNISSQFWRSEPPSLISLGI